MDKQIEQEIHELCHEVHKELEELENRPTYEHNPRAISVIDKLRKLRGICRMAAAKCDEIELKIVEDGTDK